MFLNTIDHFGVRSRLGTFLLTKANYVHNIYPYYRRLQQSSKTWEKIFSWIKMDSRKYSMYRCFFSIPEDALILCIGFFYRFRKMLLEAEIIDSVFYVCHRDYICIYIIIINNNSNNNIYITSFIKILINYKPSLCLLYTTYEQTYISNMNCSPIMKSYTRQNWLEPTGFPPLSVCMIGLINRAISIVPKCSKSPADNIRYCWIYA